MKKIVCMLMLVGCFAPLMAEMDHELIEEVGYIEEEDEVASADSRERNEMTFYDKNRDRVQERRRREAIRAWRELQRQQYCCPEGEYPCNEEECHK